MKNIPVFTTSYGIATLILREIPYSQRAYILPQSVFTSLPELVQECAGFCRAAGAEQIFAKLDAAINGAAFQCEIWELTRRGALPQPERELALSAVTTENSEAYRSLYNEKFALVDNAAYCDRADAAKLIEEGGWLYVADGEVLGLGQVQGSELRAIATARKGLGFDLAVALMKKLDTEQVHLSVASSNAPALRLYERLGFEKTAVRSRWYRIL
ncbi:MAG: hypothetical protein E7449_06305 [Ruminococcaceae bacterium]|nr:hypothetical protein [Oscillospiraceae bacterium]